MMEAEITVTKLCQEDSFLQKLRVAQTRSRIPRKTAYVCKYLEVVSGMVRQWRRCLKELSISWRLKNILAYLISYILNRNNPK